MSLVRPGKLFRNCLTNQWFSGQLFKFLIVYFKKGVVEQIGFSICFSRHFSTASSYVCNLKILKNLSYLYEVFSRRKTTNDCCYRLSSSNVNTVKEMYSRWYRSQFNKFVKAWVRVEFFISIFGKLHQIKI